MRERSLNKWNEFQSMHPTAELWTKEVLIEKGILEGNDKITANRPILILSGPPGSGKTTLSSSLLDKFEVIDQDKIRPWIKSVKQYCEVQCDTPLLIVCSFQVAKLCKSISKYKLFVILENESIYRQRLEERGGRYTQTAMRRHKRLETVATKYHGIVGTQEQIKSAIAQAKEALDFRPEPLL